MTPVEMVIDGLRQSPVNHQWVVVLKEKLEERYLPVYIGSSQAEALKRELTDSRLSRAIGAGPISKEIKGIGSNVRSVKLDKFDNNVFSAKLVLAAPGKSVACPPAKALAIAVRARASIFADEAMLNKAAVTVPA